MKDCAPPLSLATIYYDKKAEYLEKVKPLVDEILAKCEAMGVPIVVSAIVSSNADDHGMVTGARALSPEVGQFDASVQTRYVAMVAAATGDMQTLVFPFAVAHVLAENGVSAEDLDKKRVLN